MIFSKEFVRHFDICNDYKMYHKKLFYLVKNMVLGHYTRFDGYDLQKWSTVTISSFGDVYEVDEEYGNKCWMNGECSEPRWATTHKHILKRFQLSYLASGNYNIIRTKLYHVPTNEFYFGSLNRNGGISKKQSDNFKEMKKLCTRNEEGNIICVGLKKQKPQRKNSPDPKESLLWLIDYLKKNDIRDKQLKIRFASNA